MSEHTFIEPAQLVPGDRCALSVLATVDGIVSRTWEDEGTHYLALRTPDRGERIFSLAQLQRAMLTSRGNEIPERVGR